MDKASSALIAESQAAFQITMLVQTGIGTLPLVYYGTENRNGSIFLLWRAARC